MDKKEIIKLLNNIGVLLELKGENPFKSRAYTNAARIIETMTDDVSNLIITGEIERIKGIGRAITQKLKIFVETGSLPYYEELKSSIPPGLPDLLTIPGMGAKKVKAVYDKLGVASVGELEYACRENRLRDLSGFGQKSQDKILQAIELKKKYSERFHFPNAQIAALGIWEYLKKRTPEIIRIEIAGSLRRKKEVIKDIDLAASAEEQHHPKIMDYFAQYPQNRQTIVQGVTKSTIILESGIHCDLRLVTDEQYPFLLHHSTGSKEHNTAMRQMAKNLGLTMNEYGLFTRDKEDKILCKDENEIYKSLNLQYIAPEIRENKGEIEAAEEQSLPELIQAADIKGIFHVHSVWSDGGHSIEEMALKCKKMGFHYIGISDHSKSAFYANGLNEERIKQQHEEIERLNEKLSGIHIFKGIEADILTDGRLDYEDRVLESFDFVIASVHSVFNLSEEEMTRRICRAVEHPSTTMLGHPTGRLLLGREPYAVDMDRVLECAASANTIIEINANPYRLDLDWRMGRKAAKLEIVISINPDAHSREGIEDYLYGVGIARKAWFEPKRVLNTRSTEEVKLLLNHK